MSGNTETKKQDLGAWFKGSPGAKMPTPTAKDSGTKTTAEKPASAGFYVPASEIDREWDLGKHPVRIQKAEDYRAEGSGNESFKLRLVGLAGAMKNAGIDDYWPKVGKGLKKTHKGCKAVDLVDENNNISIPGGAAQLERRDLWVEILDVDETYRDKKSGEQKTRTVRKIGYLSYWHISEFEMPKEGDLFAEEGQPLPAKTNGASTPPETVTVQTENGTVTAVAATGEVVGVEAGAAPPAF